MTDRELLELAEKAAGLSIKWDEDWHYFMRDARPVDELCSEWLPWRPLTYDGDALRLAVKLGMNLTLKGSQATHPYVTAEIDLHYTSYQNAAFEEQPDDGDPYAAIRRAIVRAAAAIGEGMP